MYLISLLIKIVICLNSVANTIKLNGIYQIKNTSVIYIYDSYGLDLEFMSAFTGLLKTNVSFEFELLNQNNIRFNYKWFSIFNKLIEKQNQENNIDFVFVFGDMLSMIKVRILKLILP